MDVTEETQHGTPPRGEGAIKAKRYIAGGATAAALGVLTGIAGGGPIAAPLTLAGLAAFLLGIHKLGRSGPPADFPAAH